MNDYDRIAQVIEHLVRHQHRQPSLQELADVAGQSPHHLQRVFSRFAGVSPKKFLQCLTVEVARQHLKNGRSVLDAALDSGLSGPGRLHDLTVLLEAASPGEIKSGGRGWTVTAGVADSPFGPCFLAQTPRGIARLDFIPDPHQIDIERLVRSDWPLADVRRDDAAVRRIAEDVFPRRPRSAGQKISPLRCYVRGTDFQVRVWRALLQIPPGDLASYQAVAEFIGQPRACRAVGAAVGRNAIAWLIPCHRVIRESGVIGQYRWGGTRKQIMIATELSMQAQRDKS